ncbi:unnamed protein product [Pleuronectes platessa]|uniref:Uncharacterized protein n=1 Tax=Pleuronectes platessa TaxID=8262 RepID=A0A9N7UK55_PLEPL|nr:unnamed protein product [Pleuronectes platessa]
MRAQLGVQDEEIRSMKLSLEEEQRRYTQLQQDTHEHTNQLNTQIQQLLLQQQDEQTHNQRLQSDLQECQSRLRIVEAELQSANNKANNSEHQLTQLSLKTKNEEDDHSDDDDDGDAGDEDDEDGGPDPWSCLSSSEQLQQQIFLMNQQLVLLRETNRALTNQLEGGGASRLTEASMLQCSVGKECQRLRDSDVQQRQKLEAANHRILELENQLTRKDQLIQDQKKLLEDTKAQNRAELSACDSRCLALQRVSQSLQTEMLHLYSQIHLETHSRPQDVCGRPNGGSVSLPVAQSSLRPRPPLLLLSPLAVGSFLEQRARQLFGPTNRSPEEEEEEEEEEEAEVEDEEVQSETLLLDQEVEEATLLSENPQMTPPSLATAHSFTAFKPAALPQVLPPPQT